MFVTCMPFISALEKNIIVPFANKSEEWRRENIALEKEFKKGLRFKAGVRCGYELYVYIYTYTCWFGIYWFRFM